MQKRRCKVPVLAGQESPDVHAWIVTRSNGPGTATVKKFRFTIADAELSACLRILTLTSPAWTELTDEQWHAVSERSCPRPKNTNGRPAHGPRLVLNGILFYIRNALTWINIPSEYPSYVTCFRRYHEWRKAACWSRWSSPSPGTWNELSGLEFIDAWKTASFRYTIENGVLTIYLPKEYSDYWMQPTAVLMLMWMFTFTIGVYQEAYSQTCKKLDRVQLKGRQVSAALAASWNASLKEIRISRN